MPEHVPIPTGPEQPVTHRHGQPIIQVLGVRHSSEQLVGHFTAQHRCRTQHALSRGRELRHPHSQHVSH